jgi:lysozyme family protein
MTTAQTADLFSEAMDFIWLPENDGQPYHITTSDPGGATSWGVTYDTWASWRELHGDPVSMAGFKRVLRPDLLPLYRTMFWNACNCDALGPIGIQVFDAAVNCGPGHAALFLQALIGVAQDRAIGPLTIAAARAQDQPALSRLLCSRREEFYATRLAARYFERGWDARAEACRDLVLSILASKVHPVWPVAENGHTPETKET